MKRSRFLKMLGLGAIAAPVAIPLAVKAATGLSEMIKVKPQPPLTGDGIMAMVEAMSKPDPKQEFVVWTGKEGMKKFNEAMKDMNDFAKDGEKKMMYGKKHKSKYY